MQNALIFLVKTLTDLYLLTFLLRFILQLVRADFYNPLAEFILRITNPLVIPARRLIPGFGGIDVPTLVVMIALQAAATWLLFRIAGFAVPPDTFAAAVVLRLISLTIWFYTVSIIVYVILGWLGQTYSPVVGILRDINEPLLGRVRRLVPPVGGLDLSPLIVIILIQALAIMVASTMPLPALLR